MTETNKVILTTVIADEAGMRVDRWFKAHYPALTHGHLQKLLRKGNIRVNGGRVKADTRLEEGQEIRVPPLALEDMHSADKPRIQKLSEADRALIKDMVLFEDNELIILNKPAGLAVQGGTKSNHRHLDGMLQVYAGEGTEIRLTHRLDKETSGVIVFAKTRKAAQAMGDAFKHKKTEKTYFAITFQVPLPHEGEVKQPLLKTGEKVIIDRKEGKRAVTYYRVEDVAGSKAACVCLMPETGRTHQLRVHMAYLGTPILGDSRYSTPHAREWIEGQSAIISNQLHLHARSLAFLHPVSGKKLKVTAPFPEHFVKTAHILGFELPQA